MKDWKEQLVTAGVTLGIAFVFVVGVHLPRQRALRDLRGQVQTLEQNLARTQEQCKVLTPLTQQVEELRTASQCFEQRLPRDGQVGPFLQQIAEQMRQAQLASLEMRPATPVETKRYTELPVRVGFQGSFSSIFSFLGSLEGLERTKRIVELNLVSEVGQNGPVRADMVLSVFSAKG